MARVASRFCLLYDDNRWSKKHSSSTSEKNADGSAEKDEQTGIKSPVPAESSSKLDETGMKLLYPEGMTPFSVEQDLLRTLAEVRFIFAEVFREGLSSNSSFSTNLILQQSMNWFPPGFVVTMHRSQPKTPSTCHMLLISAKSTDSFF